MMSYKPKPKLKTENQKPKTKNQKPKTKDQKPKLKTQSLRTTFNLTQIKALTSLATKSFLNNCDLISILTKDL